MKKETWMWLSFRDPDKNRFLGAAIVKGRDVDEAADEAWRQNCNPGGEVRAVYVDPERFPADVRNRLLRREEAAALAQKQRD